ncbi:Nodal modulator 2,Nodal modulator 3,Nodal modulator 1 [Mytilus coruscus]|uniref:Nodal modulator 2,Nodal modulator 3,Nodal modulator 1 n=1 Tax=Mytilus coruscus TaxID=42192 RepID=A0A6J8DI61_MYTCO|nr:Nodal modulator 2,Nodal modulator 3,Nodal modulator 1 [Mytilus coruscus]
MKTNLFLFCLLAPVYAILIGQINGDSVFGCGGFVKSDVDINFSLVEVKLYTMHGSIKYQTDCAPNTGYYLIPLYDKADFKLKVEPPKGWSFEPESVELKIDGTTDPCSRQEDINFKFTGFSVNGKVISKGQVNGPSGVTVTLHKSGSSDILQTVTTADDGSNTSQVRISDILQTVTTADDGSVTVTIHKSGSSDFLQTVTTADDGSYIFSKVMPGDYDLKATASPKYKFIQQQAKATVTSDNADVGNSIVIAGYQVVGSVQSEGEPIKGVNFVLFSKVVNKQDVVDCEKTVPKGFVSPDKQESLCYVTSKDDGTFTFPSLPVGEYSIVPFFKGEHIRFDVVPASMEFRVLHNAVKLQQTFQVSGFSVSGRVINSQKGSGVGNAAVYVNGKKQTTTKPDVLKISPNTPHLPDIIAIKFSLCGQIVIDKLPEGLRQVPPQRRVIYFPEGKSSDAVSIATDKDGKFCTHAASGKYVIKVHLTEEEMGGGLQIIPSEKSITIPNAPVLDVMFTQFRAKVTGAVACLEKCGSMEVSLEAVGRDDFKQTSEVKESGKEGIFYFENVMPGKYKAILMHDTWCWKEKTIDIEVTDKDLTGIKFIQTGYILKCSISHEIKLHFAHEKKVGTVGSFNLNKGKNRFCLAQPGVYKLTPDSCHKSSPELLTLTAVKHLIEGSVTTEEAVQDLTVTLLSMVDKTPVVLGPLTTDNKSPPADTKDNKAPQPTGPFVYKFSHWARTGEKLEVSVSSKELLFSPAKTEVAVLGDTCAGEVAKFIGKRGVFIIGHIKPAIEGVNITVTTKGAQAPSVSINSAANGGFKIGPLHKGNEYEVSAEKHGYVFVKQDGEMAVFSAYKLGEISVKVIDKEGTALPGVVLSLSGDKQYRSNNVTQDNGTIVFPELGPGKYFLRSMMKEYQFEPASQLIEVLEGTTMNITISGKRVAFSCYGQVTSLNGEAEQGIIVEAMGEGEGCSLFQEESKTDEEGLYRIRGLQPKCTYVVRLKTEVNKHIERSAPKSRNIMIENSDFTGVNIIAFRKMNQMDISGNIVCHDDYLSTLKIHLYKDDNVDSPIHTVNMGVTSFFFLPSLPINNEKYLIRIESSLSRSSYDYTLPETEFLANQSYKHFTVDFTPQRKSLEQELNQGSFLILPLTLLLAYAIYNYQTLLPFMLRSVNQLQTMLTVNQADLVHTSHSGGGGGDTSLYSEQAGAAKKKAKPRKT